MYFTFQGYQSEDNSAIIGAKTQIIKAGGQMVAQMASLEVKGYVYGSSQQTVSDAMNTLETALARPYGDFLFYQDDGAVSATNLYNGSSLSGVTVTDGPNWLLDARGANYVRQNEYTFTVSAEYPISTNKRIYLNFEERISRRGGGPRRRVKECLNKLPQRQQVRAYTVYEAVQEGNAQGYLFQPPLPPPIWPQHLMENPDTVEATPKREGKGLKDFYISWKYFFQSATPLTGSPNIWPA